MVISPFWSTRMRTSQMLPVLEKLDAVGYEALECWGGATFDSCLRFLDEDPWQRLRTLKAHLKKYSIADVVTWPELIGLQTLC